MPGSKHHSAGERRVLRPPPATWWLVVGAFSVVLALTVIAFAVGLEAWLRAGLTAFSLFGVVALVDVGLQRVVLEDRRLTTVAGFRRRVLPREAIESVTWEKGAGASVKLVDGRWVGLPGVGRSSQGLANSVRAWLERTAPAKG